MLIYTIESVVDVHLPIMDKMFQTVLNFFPELEDQKEDTHVHLALRRNVTYAKKPACGYYYYDEDEDIHIVVLDVSLTDEILYLTFFHEMVHLHQKLTKKYVYDPDEQVCQWNGKQYSVDYIYSLPYGEIPWEKEALLLEKTLFYLYCQNARNESKKVSQPA